MSLSVGGFSHLEANGEGLWAVCKTIYGTEHAFSVTSDEAERILTWFTGGAMIQEALGDLETDYRELLLSGIPPGEWENFIGFELADDEIDPYVFPGEPN